MSSLEVPIQVSLMEEVLDFLTSAPSLEQIIALHPSEAVEARIAYLLELNRQGHLGEAEQHELEEFMQLHLLMSLLKNRAQQKLQTSA